jgi:hypothetical protein
VQSDRKLPQSSPDATTRSQSQREQAMEATARYFFEDRGFSPDQDSEEWEEQYRLQFARVKNRQPSQRTAAPTAAEPSETDDGNLPPLTGPAGELRWAATLRSQRLAQIERPEIRAFVTRAWLGSKEWLATETLSPAQFLRRAEVQHDEQQKRLGDEAASQARTRERRAVETAELRRQVAAAGVTAEGLVELVDLSARVPSTALAGKLAELVVEQRRLRIFDTGESSTLMVLEKSAAGRAEYGIQRDDGLVRDLKLFAAAYDD